MQRRSEMAGEEILRHDDGRNIGVVTLLRKLQRDVVRWYGEKQWRHTMIVAKNIPVKPLTEIAVAS